MVQSPFPKILNNDSSERTNGGMVINSNHLRRNYDSDSSLFDIKQNNANDASFTEQLMEKNKIVG